MKTVASVVVSLFLVGLIYVISKGAEILFSHLMLATILYFQVDRLIHEREN